MAHHGRQPINEELQAMFAKQILEDERQMQISAKELGLGPTGEFPEGRLADHDEGEIQIAVTHSQGKVVINFGSPVAFIGFTPEQADDIAYLILKHSVDAKAKRK